MPHPKWIMASAVTALVLSLAQAAAAVLPGDLDGDGDLDVADENLLRGFYGTSIADPGWEPAADLNGDGVVGHPDLGLFGGGFGASGPLDSAPPSLVSSLNDIPDDMNDLLVAPPDAFLITFALDSAGGSVIDTASLSVTSSEAIGANPPGAQLASFFTVTPTRAFWEVPIGSDLDRTSHYVTVQVSDLAGNAANEVYGFAVRDFGFQGPPLENLNTIFLDFDQDRSLGPELDFVEDLRSFGLSSATAPAIETLMRDRLVTEIVERAHGYYGRNGDGSPGPDAVNVVFEASLPTGTHSRLCVGGDSSLGGSFLGAASMDVNNVLESTDECGIGHIFGVFPQAIDNLWGADPGYQAIFLPLDPGTGTPVGDDPLDAIVTSPGFDPATATAPELARWNVIEAAVAAFGQIVAGGAAHETGHMLGLVAHGAPPEGLHGGTSGGSTDHNVTPGGATPAENFLMNPGGAFSFDEMAGLSGEALPIFRPLGWAYLHDRLVLDDRVTGLFPAPTLTGLNPNPVALGGQSQMVTITGTGFLDPVQIELLLDGDPTPNPLLVETWIDPQTVTAVVNPSFVPPGLQDVRLTNADGQVVILEDGVEVQP